MTALKYVVLVLVTLLWSSEARLVAAEGSEAAPSRLSRNFLVYFGTYTGKKSQGIYVSRFDNVTGKLSAPELAAETPNPTFLATHPRAALSSSNRPMLYAANEIIEGKVSAFAINRETGKLTFLNQQTSRGDGPCHLSVDATGQCLLVANYGSGSIAAIPVLADGSLSNATAFFQYAGSSVNKNRQQGPHAHWIDADAGNQFVLACDLGLDKIFSYKLDPSSGLLSTNQTVSTALKPGSGPRHLAFHPNGKFAYVINELNCTVAAFQYDPQRGALTQIQSVTTLPGSAVTNNSTAELEVHPSGRFLYASNRGHDSIVAYEIDRQTGKLSYIEHQPTQGRTPRNFAIDPSGRWLLAANQDTDSVVVFRIDQRMGNLLATGNKIEMGAPVCIKFVPLN